MTNKNRNNNNNKTNNLTTTRTTTTTTTTFLGCDSIELNLNKSRVSCYSIINTEIFVLFVTRKYIILKTLCKTCLVFALHGQGSYSLSDRGDQHQTSEYGRHGIPLRQNSHIEVTFSHISSRVVKTMVPRHPWYLGRFTICRKI